MVLKCELKQASYDIKNKLETYTIGSVIYFLGVLLSTIILQYYGFELPIMITVFLYIVLLISIIIWLYTVRSRCNKRKNKGVNMQIFKRSPTEDGIPNTWSPVKGLDGKIRPDIIDSNGDDFGLVAHRISADGTVSPSVVCPYGCPFHEFIKLEGWEEITEDKQE